MDTIESTLSAQDYQILVTDTDTLADGGNCNGSGPSCCDPYCATDPLKLCGDKTCPGIDGCLIELGAGREVLHVVLQVVGARQRLSAHVHLASREGDAAASRREQQGRAADPCKASVS